MTRLTYALLAAFAWVSGQRLSAQSGLQAQLEVNLGPIIIDNYATIPNSYNGITSGPYVSACSYTNPATSYRGCMQAVLSGYAQQGVVGVSFQFDMNAQGSTPFTGQSGALSQSWKDSFSLFLQDLRAANMRYVSISPDWFTYGLGNMSVYGCITGSRGAYTYDFTCTAANANAVFYRWLPWAYYYYPGVQGKGIFGLNPPKPQPTPDPPSGAPASDRRPPSARPLRSPDNSPTGLPTCVPYPSTYRRPESQRSLQSAD
jgi:hypothetical protein